MVSSISATCNLEILNAYNSIGDLVLILNRKFDWNIQFQSNADANSMERIRLLKMWRRRDRIGYSL